MKIVPRRLVLPLFINKYMYDYINRNRADLFFYLGRQILSTRDPPTYFENIYYRDNRDTFNN